MKGKKKPPKDLIERERELGWIEKERERETDQRKKEEQGFGVDHRRLWIQFFRFSAQNCLVWIRHPSLQILLYLFVICVLTTLLSYSQQ